MPRGERLVVVLGMHRSGTSALTRGLQVLGVDLGEQLIGAIPGNNEKGFWEDAAINGFNEGLLHKLESSWDRVSAVHRGALLADRLDEDREAAGALLRSRLRPGTIFAFKDPRTAVLLPFWQRVFEDLALDASYVIAVRNPEEVVQSLMRRDRMDRLKAVLLWLAYSVAAVRHTQHQERVFVAYSSLMENAERQLRRIALALQLPGPEQNPGALRAYTDDFLSPELRHHVAPADALQDTADTPLLVGELYQLLNQAADDQTPALGAPGDERWAEIEARYADLLPLLRQLDRREVEAPSAVGAPTQAIHAVQAQDTPAPPVFVPLRKFSSLLQGVRPEFRKLVHRWSIDSVRDDAILKDGDARLVVSGWVWPKSAAEVRLATRQGDITYSYPMNVERPDVLQALQAECGGKDFDSSLCGFKYTVSGEKDFEIGFEIEGWLFWLYSAASSR